MLCEMPVVGLVTMLSVYLPCVAPPKTIWDVLATVLMGLMSVLPEQSTPIKEKTKPRTMERIPSPALTLNTSDRTTTVTVASLFSNLIGYAARKGSPMTEMAPRLPHHKNGTCS